MSCAVRLATVLLGLVKVMVRVETPPALMVAGLKDLVSTGAMITEVGRTVKVASAGAALTPLLVCKAPAGSELKKLPASGAVTDTVTVQELLAAIDEPQLLVSAKGARSQPSSLTRGSITP